MAARSLTSGSFLPSSFTKAGLELSVRCPPPSRASLRSLSREKAGLPPLLLRASPRSLSFEKAGLEWYGFGPVLRESFLSPSFEKDGLELCVERAPLPRASDPERFLFIFSGSKYKICTERQSGTWFCFCSAINF